MQRTTLMKWVTGVAEGLLAIPIAGGAFVISTGWMALLVMFILHAITLIISIKDSKFSSGSIVGMVASFLGAIPILGWMLHTAAALVLLIDAGQETGKAKRKTNN
ncbi:hypothetical protein [Halobacillus hunanensis]|uniref:hypothetical protein n=1 Tax=Halobacillus hunanensis TaxID=578214 RepID=UPI0009A8A7CB|nr:hypothetical protein [Halobacillus hunanensis]